MMHRIESADFWGRVPASKAQLADRADEIGMGVSFFVMGEDTDESAPTVVALRMKPGAVTVRHAHPCERVEIVVSGTLHVGDEVLGPGDVMTAHAGEMYGPHVAGPEGCLTYEIFSTLGGTGLTTYATESGDVTIDMTTGALRPDDVIAS